MVLLVYLRESSLLSYQEIVNIEYQDHTYGIKMRNHSAKNQIGSVQPTIFHTYPSPSQSLKEQSSKQITGINDLKVTSRVKLLNQESLTGVQPDKKLNSPLKLLERKLDSTRTPLNKYCRTCARMKLTLIDIFSEKGIQMKLNQQIRHLKNIEESDSLSTQMCMDCICDLRMSYTFFKQIKESENKLKSIQAKLFEAEMANLRKEEETSENYPLFIPQNLANLNDNGPRISAVYSVQDSESWEPDPVSNVQMEPQIQEANKFQSDDESLEEFDPEDSAYNPDREEKKNSDEKLESAPSLFKNQESFKSMGFMIKEADKRGIDSETLKRKLSEKRKENLDMSKLKATGLKDAKIRKAKNVNENLKIKENKDGVMYVTVPGAKPNELLLVKAVKVKKKGNAEKDKIFDKEEALKEKEKEQIEEQIEEYKRKREKIFGALVQNDASELCQEELKIKSDVLNVKEKESLFEKLHQEDESLNTKELIIKEDLVQIKPVSTKEISKEVLKIKKRVRKIENEVPEIRKKKSKSIEPEPKVYNNPEKSNSRIEMVKIKWANKQRKDWVEAHPGVENLVDRLKRVLGEASAEGNLQEFLDYLQQKKIITKLDDKVIVTPFQERFNSRKSVFEEEEDEEEVPEVELFHCDFCFRSDTSKEIIDEHMKIHDKKILYYCEDCHLEFPILKLKENHSVICTKKLICNYCDLILESKVDKEQHEQKHCDNIFGTLCECCGKQPKLHA